MAPGPAETAIQTERNQILQKALQNLPPRERQIVQGRIYDNKTVRELGAHFGVTQQYISKIYGKAIQKLRDWLTPYDIQPGHGERRISPPMIQSLDELTQPRWGDLDKQVQLEFYAECILDTNYPDGTF